MKLRLCIIAFAYFMSSVNLIAQDKNPFQSIGKKGKIQELSNGKFEELFDQDSIQRIGTVLINIRQMKIVDLQEGVKFVAGTADNSLSRRFLSVDPLTVQYPELTPYQFASNRPIEAVDLDGLEAKDLYMELEPVRSHRENEQRMGIVHSESRGEKYVRRFVTFGLGIFTLPVILFTGEAALTTVLANSATAMNVTVNTLTWFSNANNLLAASSVSGFVFNLVNPDPGGTYIDFPGNGDDFGRAVNMALRTKAGKVVTFAAEKGARFANQSEFFWAGKLLDEGHNVTMLRESTSKGVRTADMLVDGIKTELKEISDIKKTDAGNLSAGIARVIKESSGQAAHLILDMTKQAGVTLEIAKRGAARYFGQGSSKESIRVVGQGFDEVLKRKDYIKSN